MSDERKLIIVKLNGFITGEISGTEIYEWVLSVAVTTDYEKLIKNDKLLEQVFQFLMDINKSKSSVVPTKKVVEYFIQCLEDQKEFSSAEYRSLIDNKPARPVAVQSKSKAQGSKSPPASLGWLVIAAKIYASIFIVISLLLNGASLIKLDLLVQPNEIAPTTGEVWSSAMPHLIYGILILVAMFVKLPKLVFYGFIPVAIWGMFFYWSMATSVILKYGVSFISILVILALVALQPTAAFFVLLNQWFSRLRILQKK